MSTLTLVKPMTRLLIVGLAAASLAGFALGWFILSAPPGGEAAPGPAPDAASPLADAVRRFDLLPADVRIDREVPAVAADAQGRVVLAWASATGDLEHTLWVARSADGGRTFAPPVPFRQVPIHRYASTSKGKEVVYSTNAVPRLAAAGEAIYLGWTEAVGGGPRVDFLVARTADGGKTFAEPVRAHGPHAVKPGFTGLATGPDGRVACCWLDGRRKAPLPFCGLLRPGDEAFRAEGLVYPRPGGKGVCPCCSTEVLCAPDGTTFVAFRDNDDDYRDICVARARGDGTAGFEAPVMVNAERWRFNGCPHDGPALALFGGRLHVAWMDAHAGRHRVYHAASGLSELRFAPREVCPAAPGEQGHPRLAAGEGALHAVWDAGAGDESSGATAHEHAGHGHGNHAPPAGASRTIYWTSAPAEGDFGPARPIDPQPGAFQVNPALAVGPSGSVFVTWNEISDSGKCVAFARVPAPGP
jgi:hypothetical protein